MIGTLLRGLLSRDDAHERSRRAPERAPRRRSTIRPALEVLEDRTVPAAIRNLPGFLTNTLPANDDGSTGTVNVGFQMNFFGVNSNQVFVNNNGNVTFNQALAQFTPSDLNSDNGGIPIIAAFFADVDTRGTGSGLVQYGTDTFCGRPVFGVNYINVGYFSQATDLLNSFQIILIDRSETGAGNFDIEFNYDQIEWETGDASGGNNGLGGNSARVGYSNGTGTTGTFFELPGSGVNGAFLDGGPNALIQQQLLSSTPGRIHFLVRNGQVVQEVEMAAMTNLDVTDQVRIFNPFRWITDADTGIMRGNLTIVNVAPPTDGPVAPTNVNACLDIVTTPSGGGATPGSAQTIAGPLTVITDPRDVELINANGLTARGRPFLTSSIIALAPLTPPVRVQVQVFSPSFAAPNTFYQGQFPTQVISGLIDLSQL